MESDFFYEVDHRHVKQVASLEYSCVNKSIVYVITHERKARINTLSRSKSPKTQQVEGFTHMIVISNVFSRHRLGWYVCTRENFAYSNSFAKVSIPVKSLIPWASQGIIVLTGTETLQLFFSYVCKVKQFKELFCRSLKWNSC